MRKLFPSSWIERADIFKHRHAAAAQAFEENWLAWLEEGLRRVKPRALHAQGSDPVQALRAISGSALLDLDQTLRSHTLCLGQPTQPSSSREDADSEESTDAYLFVATCNASGCVRERALALFASYPGSLALAAGLLRSTDWVPQVRTEAISLISRITPHVAPSHLVGQLELVARLKGRMRVDEALWQACIEQRLKAAESQDALWSTARDPRGSSLLRRSAFEYLMLGNPPSIPQVLSSALVDSDLRVGLWALDQIRGLGDPEARARLLTVALDAKHAAVNAVATRAADHLDRWLSAAQRRFTTPSATQVQHLIRMSRAAQSRHPGRQWRSVDLELAAFLP